MSEMLQQRKASLTPAQRAALERRLRGLKPVVKYPARTEPLPLSYAQERIWLHQQMYPASFAYNRPTPLRLFGLLQVDKLQDALRELGRRHESLRTRVAVVNGQATQRIANDFNFPLPVTDIAQSADAAARVRELVAAEIRTPFDLEREMPWRARLLRLTDNEHLLVLVFHHFAFDAWSQTVLLNELPALYESAVNGQEHKLAQLPVQYADLAAWERCEPDAAARTYWARQLADASVLQLPTDFDRPAEYSEQAGCVPVELPLEIVVKLRELARSEQTTLFTTLLSAFSTLLHRYSQEDDVIVGCPVAGRSRPETEGLIGVFINTLPLRVQLAPSTTFRQLMHQTAKASVDALTHQHAALQTIVRETGAARTTVAGSPLFNTLFVYENMPTKAACGAGVVMELHECDLDATLVDLSLELMETGNRVAGAFHYRAVLWERQSIERLAGHFLTLLQSIVTDPDQAIGHLPLLTPAEQQRLLVDFNSTAADFPRDRCVHQLFAEQAQRTPESIAVQALSDQRTLTYAQLERHANQLANYLRALGIREESRVVLLAPRSIEATVGILGILKAGAAFVPLEPSSATERMARILRDVQPAAVLTCRHLVDGSLDGYRVVTFDDSNIADAPTTSPATAVTPANAAYVIYTSGSSGAPNGVVVEHRSLVNFCMAAIAAYELRADDRVLQLASLSFDTSLEEMLPTWLVGGTVVLRSDQMLDSVARFLELCRLHAVSILDLPTAFWHLLCDQMCSEDLPLPDAVRLVIIGGEAAQRAAVLRWRARIGDRVRLLNTYGPTEATVVTVVCDLTRENDEDIARRGVPIGRPLANTTAHVLDRNLQQTPIGVPGELFLGGAALARGYLHRPELTAKRFITRPGHFAGRLYRTGDSVRWRSDGVLEFLGRSDRQIKLRGYRIDLAEIEAALHEQPAIRQAVVLLHEDRANPASESRLIAYVVPTPGGDVHGVRTCLREKLPDYMIPSHFVTLAALPLTTSGKIDRRALPEPDVASSTFVPPRTDVEEHVAGVWAELLRVSAVGVHDNFFEIGGHSLLAMRVVAHLRRDFDVDISMRLLFEKPTVAELSEAIRRREVRADLPPLTVADRRTPTPLASAQARVWQYSQTPCPNIVYVNRTQIDFTGPLNVPALERAFDELIRRHELLRTTFVVHAGRPVQDIRGHTPFKLPVTEVPQHVNAKEVVQRIFEEEGRSAMRLDEGPLFRAQLLRMGEDRHSLLLIMHHILYDASSWQTLYRELETLYAAYCRGERSPLPEPHWQFADFAVWEREVLRPDGRLYQQQLAYWLKQLGTPSQAAPLSFQRQRSSPPRRRWWQRWWPRLLRQRPVVPAPSPVRANAHFPDRAMEALQALGRQEGCSIFITMLALLKLALHRDCHADEILVGTYVQHRPLPELDGMLGFFSNYLILRTRLSGDPTFRELLRRVRETTLSAFAHQYLPFEELSRVLASRRRVVPAIHAQFLMRMTPVRVLNLVGVTAQFAGGARSDPPPTFNFSVTFAKQPGCWAIADGNLYDPAGVRAIVQDYTGLLEHVVAAPDLRVSALPAPIPVQQ